MTTHYSTHGDNIYKFKPLVESLNGKYRELEAPDDHLCVVESMIRLKRRSTVKQYNPMKLINYLNHGALLIIIAIYKVLKLTSKFSRDKKKEKKKKKLGLVGDIVYKLNRVVEIIMCTLIFASLVFICWRSCKARNYLHVLQ